MEKHELTSVHSEHTLFAPGQPIDLVVFVHDGRAVGHATIADGVGRAPNSLGEAGFGDEHLRVTLNV